MPVSLSVLAGAATVTVALWLAVPPGPVHVTVWVVVAVKAGVVNVPAVPVPPPPVEVHEVLLVDDQLRVDVAPFAIEEGDAVRVTVGARAPATVTVALWLAVPPGPAHVTV